MKTTLIQNKPNPFRLIRVDIMVGIAMIFIVLSQNIHDFAPQWYAIGIFQWMNRFCMEVFLFLMAFLMRHNYKRLNSVKDHLSYIGQNFSKIFIPFLLVGVALASASAWSLGIEKRDALNYVLTEIRTLLLYPFNSQAWFLGFLYILFGLSVFSPIVFRLPSWLKMGLCILSIGLPLLVSSQLLGGNIFCQYSFFYFLGILCAEGSEQLRELKTWMIGLASIPFLLWSIRFISASLQNQAEATFLEVGPQDFNILAGCFALAMLYFLSRIIEKSQWASRALGHIANDWFWIFLLEMFIDLACSSAWSWAKLDTVLPFFIFWIIEALLCIIIPIGLAELSRKTITQRKPKLKKK